VLCHEALEEITRVPRLRDCDDPAELKTALLAAFEREARARYGSELTLPLVIQFESARHRLGRAAEIQAEARAQGWVIERTEEKFKLEIGGLVVAGRIDRIESHRETGAWRVLDYKTSDTAGTPGEKHFRPLRAGESPPEWAMCEVGGKAKVWTDLQLALYCFHPGFVERIEEQAHRDQQEANSGKNRKQEQNAM